MPIIVPERCVEGDELWEAQPMIHHGTGIDVDEEIEKIRKEDQGQCLNFMSVDSSPPKYSDSVSGIGGSILERVKIPETRDASIKANIMMCNSTPASDYDELKKMSFSNVGSGAMCATYGAGDLNRTQRFH